MTYTGYPFTCGIPAYPQGSGWCPQCGMYCVVSGHASVNRTAPDRWAARCDGCQYANDTYGHRRLWRAGWGDTPADAGVQRVYLFYGPHVPFAIWADTIRGCPVIAL